jgi:tetratricopeptide (TPR) repeat protein
MTRRPDHLPDEEEELTEAEVSQRRRRTLVRRLVIAGLALAVVLSAIGALAYPRIKEWRARQFAAQALDLLAAGKLQEAFNNASSAVQVGPAVPEARRAQAAVLFAAGRPDGAAHLQHLIDAGQASAQDRLDLAEAALRFGDPATAEREAFHLLQAGDQTAAALLILARVRISQQRLPDAKQALRESIEAGAGPEASLLLARLDLTEGTPDSIASAVAVLEPLTTRPDEAGLQALVTLLSSPALRQPAAGQWIETLKRHPMAADEHRFAAASAEIETNPKAREATIERTIAEYRGGTAEQLAALARWLNLQREFDRVLEVIPPEEALARSDLFLIRLDAMAGRGDWEGLSTLLAGNNLPLQAPIVLLYRGRAARERGDASESAALYRRAVIDSAPTPDLMWYVINYLERIGEEAVLEQELVRLTSNPSAARQAFQALVPIIQRRQDAEELFQLYNRMIKALPADPAVQNDHRYFAAMTGRRADESGAAGLVAAEPQMLAYRITLALTRLKNGRPAEALAVFDGVTLDPAQIQPYQRAVLAAVLGANGRSDEARQLARSVPGDSVTAAELDLIKEWRDTD